MFQETEMFSKLSLDYAKVTHLRRDIKKNTSQKHVQRDKLLHLVKI